MCIYGGLVLLKHTRVFFAVEYSHQNASPYSLPLAPTFNMGLSLLGENQITVMIFKIVTDPFIFQQPTWKLKTPILKYPERRPEA